MTFVKGVLVVLTLATLSSGCVSPNTVGMEAIAAGNLDRGYALALAGAQRGDPAGYNNMGVVEIRRGNRAEAVKMFIIAARMGLPVARANLVQLGEEVPAADLEAAAPVNVASDNERADLIWQAIIGASNDIADAAFDETPSQPRSQSKPLPSIPPLGAKSCAPKAVIENGTTRWIQVCR